MICIVAGVIAIDVEGMSTPAIPRRVIISTINDRTALIELILQQGGPLVIIIIGSGIGTVIIGARFVFQMRHLLIVAEELDGTQDIFTHCSTGTGRVIHLFLLTHVAHQPRYSIGLGSSIAARVLVKHVVPVKGDRGQGFDLETITVVGITLDFGRGIGRILPVVEYHRQRSGRATGQAERAVIGGTMVVIGRTLVPLGSE